MAEFSVAQKVAHKKRTVCREFNYDHLIINSYAQNSVSSLTLWSSWSRNGKS